MSFKKIEMFIFISSSIVCPKIYMVHILDIFFNENTHTCGRSANEIDKRENIQDNFIGTLSFCTRKN